MTKVIETDKYQRAWHEARSWVTNSLRELSESDMDARSAETLAEIAIEAYYTNEEDFFPNTSYPLNLRRIDQLETPSPLLFLALAAIKKADIHGYARQEITEYEREHKLAV